MSSSLLKVITGCILFYPIYIIYLGFDPRACHVITPDGLNKRWQLQHSYTVKIVRPFILSCLNKLLKYILSVQ